MFIPCKQNNNVIIIILSFQQKLRLVSDLGFSHIVTLLTSSQPNKYICIDEKEVIKCESNLVSRELRDDSPMVSPTAKVFPVGRGV